MGTHGEQAKQLFFDGYNCAQSVFCAFCDVHGMSLDEAARLSSSFGGGMGRLREVCGALSGIFMVIGALYGGYEVTDRAAKTQHYTMIQELASKFRERYGTLLCRDILGLPALSGLCRVCGGYFRRIPGSTWKPANKINM